MDTIKGLRIKLFLDGARIEDIKAFSGLEYIKGFTTNPSLMKKAGVVDYAKFVEEALLLAKGKPISFEVISDDFDQMKAQAIKLSKFGDNIYVKIPITNTKGDSSLPLIDDLTRSGLKLNVTAIMTLRQIEGLAGVLSDKTRIIISVFAGRIADTGVDPVPVLREARRILKDFKNAQLLWASPREVLNIFQAQEAGCDIITILPELLSKMHLVGYRLEDFSLDTVKMFYNDALSSGLKL